PSPGRSRAERRPRRCRRDDVPPRRASMPGRGTEDNGPRDSPRCTGSWREAAGWCAEAGEPRSALAALERRSRAAGPFVEARGAAR
ncbi:hypothetical protein RZS08_57860, partial [Arthrospira platensis SPKY1]|nr:hypothetical protein [Arthrospira platensis SPKY1]